MDVLHDPNPEEGAYYLNAIFTNNGICLSNFLQEVDNIICMKYPRLNTLVLRGPTSTGKTLIAKNVVKPYNYGTVSRDGDATAFYLQNLLDHDVALMEEPHISMSTVQSFKELFAGSPLLVQVKNRAPRQL
ncbi:Initiator protein NS1 [Taenia solium]|eukprot:TsM_000982300 transcript=TsM_000982300 gene=TsM_000982300